MNIFDWFVFISLGLFSLCGFLLVNVMSIIAIKDFKNATTKRKFMYGFTIYLALIHWVLVLSMTISFFK